MSKTELYVKSIVDGFNLASRLLWHERLKTSEFIQVANELQVTTKLKAPTQFWKNWTSSPTTFPLYMRAGTSALDVANRFSNSVNACIQIAKVETVGMPKDYNALSENSKSDWMQLVLIRMADFCTSSTSVERFREVDLMKLKIRLEVSASTEVKTTSKEPAKTESESISPVDSKWSDAITEFKNQTETPTAFAKDWVGKNSRRINKLVKEHGSKEAAANKLRNAIYKATKKP